MKTAKQILKRFEKELASAVKSYNYLYAQDEISYEDLDKEREQILELKRLIKWIRK